MKYTTKVEINLPRKTVIALYDNPENRGKWQPGLLSYDNISGEPGKPGAKAKLNYQMGKREIEMTETIEERNLPDTLSATYEAKGMWNHVVNHFIEESSSKTLWKMENEFKGAGIMKLMLILMPGMFKKQTLKSMKDFKQFAEQEQAS